MNKSRRDFLKTGGLTIAATGLVPSIISSCTNDPGDQDISSGLNNMLGEVVPLNEEDYIERQLKLIKALEENGIDAIFIEGATNLKYFFNISWWLSERIFGPIISVKGDPIWICPAFEEERAKEQVPEGHEIRTWEEHESPYVLFAKTVKDMGLNPGRIALGPSVRSFLGEGIQRVLKADLLDGSVAVNSVRGKKTEKEIAFMDLANRITKKAYKYGFDRMEEGMTKGDLANLIRKAHSDMGVSGGGGPMFGFTSAFPHGTRQTRDLHDGDIVLVDGGCSVEGFRSDVTRTVVFGNINDRHKEVFNAVLEAQQAAHNAIKPGVTCGEIDAVARKVIDKAGFGPGYKYFAHRLGHGIGMDGHEYPYLVKDNDLVLEPGMTFSNEPGIYIYGEFGVRIEDCFVVTETGARMLGGMLTKAIDDPFGG